MIAQVAVQRVEMHGHVVELDQQPLRAQVVEESLPAVRLPHADHVQMPRRADAVEDGWKLEVGQLSEGWPRRSAET